jgi:hypothetical protein
MATRQGSNRSSDSNRGGGQNRQRDEEGKFEGGRAGSQGSSGSNRGSAGGRASAQGQERDESGRFEGKTGTGTSGNRSGAAAGTSGRGNRMEEEE